MVAEVAVLFRFGHEKSSLFLGRFSMFGGVCYFDMMFSDPVRILRRMSSVNSAWSCFVGISSSAQTIASTSMSTMSP
mgnify:CR=1 FL=1